MRGRSVLVVSIIVVAVACGPKPPREQLQKNGKSVASWSATAEMVGREWLDGSVPGVYARETMEQGARQVSRARTSLASVAAGDSLAVAALRNYERLDALLARMEQAVNAGDRSTVARVTALLPDEQRSIRALSERSGASQ